MDVESLLAEQVAYYRARAPEYDDWWQRLHDYDDGPEFAQAWQAEIGELTTWLDSAGPLGDVLEVAAGTGNWTAELVPRASSVTAVDASPEVLEVNAAKVASDGVEYVVADVFGWEPPRAYDTVFFAFWLSHVPAERSAQFWQLVDRALADDGAVLFCDNIHPDELLTRSPERLVHPSPARHEQRVASGRVTRSLRDGSTFEIVKRYWTAPQLEAELAALGWEAVAAETSFAFIHCIARRASA